MISFSAPIHKPCCFEVSDKGSDFSRHLYYSGYAGRPLYVPSSLLGARASCPPCLCGLEARTPRGITHPGLRPPLQGGDRKTAQRHFPIPSLEGKRKRVQHVFGCGRTRFLFVPRSGGVGSPSHHVQRCGRRHTPNSRLSPRTEKSFSTVSNMRRPDGSRTWVRKV